MTGALFWRDLNAATFRTRFRSRFELAFWFQMWYTSLADMPLFFQPGTKWNYSLGTDVCGRLVEVLSGEPFDVYLQRKVLTPLGMHATKFTVDATTADRLVANYTPKFERTRAPAEMPAGGTSSVQYVYDITKAAICT